MDAVEHAGRVDLVVDGVEHEHDVEGPARPAARATSQTSKVTLARPCAPPRCAPGDGLLVEVVADEGRGGERPRQQVHGVAGAAPDVGRADSGCESLGEAGASGQDAVDQEPS